jgi:hypothetical protein
MLDGNESGKVKVNVPATVPMLSGFAALATLLHALHCVRVVGGYVSRCACNSVVDLMSFAGGLDDVVVAGLLVHAGIFLGLCAATVTLVRRK